ERVVPVINRAGRSPRARAEMARAYRDLLGADAHPALGAPLFVPNRRGLDDLIATAAPLPDALTRPLGTAVAALLDRLPRVARATPQPERVAAGSLGSWTAQSGGL